ncbi:DedA family protein [Glaciihabitans sp. dw_435]|uniref:DedA family protein n=1 Tax=Glaciihabitans sp. dw_435 TaxID=2720081 RepID=UPI001BD1D92F|nr:VTT domain-containing protein [Glaciihabitans sp. dw_435]
MDVLAELLTSWVSSPWAVVVIFAVCVLDGFLPVVPGETVLVAAAAVAWTAGPASLPIVALAGMGGAWLGDNIAYLLGRRVGAAGFAWSRRPRVARVTGYVTRELASRPESIILTGRFIPVARVLISIAAGATGVAHRRFLVLSLIASAAWTTLTIGIAIFAGTFLSTQPVLATVYAMLIALVVGVIVDRVLAWTRDGRRQGEAT